jgi:hypothetical protein
MYKTMERNICITVLVLCTGCLSAQAQPPVWVTNKNAAYPEQEWLSVVESNMSREQAQTAATSALARVFRVDVKSMTNVMQNFSQTVSGGKSAVTQNTALKQQIDTSTNVTGLMGVINDVWTAPTGEVYVCARMNRKTGSATYSSIIAQNARTIQSLIEDAEIAGVTFGAYQSLAFAYSLAAITDNYLNILSVLDPASRRTIQPGYGDAASVRTLMQNLVNNIVIGIDVSGDVDGRISKVFAQVFSARKFKTAQNSGNTPYTLVIDFSINEEPAAGSGKRVRYLINASLSTMYGEEILSFTDSKRITSITMEQARQNALRDAETAIGDTEFAKAFDAYLASLL